MYNIESFTYRSTVVDIKGKTFLVTGGAQGMGRSFTLELARLGANVMFCDLNAEKTPEVEAAGADLEGGVKGNGSQCCRA